MILDGVLSPAEDTWLFSLIYTVELDAVGALFEAGSLTITLIISPPFPFLALTLNQLLVPPELALDTVALSIDVLTSASSSKYSLPSSNTLPPAKLPLLVSDPL